MTITKERSVFRRIRFIIILKSAEEQNGVITISWGVHWIFRNATVSVLRRGFHTPQWAKGAVFYQIFVDRFRNGCRENDPLDQEYAYIGGHTVAVRDWEKYPDALDVRCFYGGDLQGVEEKLDYLKGLGVEAI